MHIIINNNKSKNINKNNQNYYELNSHLTVFFLPLIAGVFHVGYYNCPTAGVQHGERVAISNWPGMRTTCVELPLLPATLPHNNTVSHLAISIIVHYISTTICIPNISKLDLINITFYNYSS